MAPGSGDGHRSVVIEADGGSRGNPGEAAYGAVLKDAVSGDVIAERAERIGVATNNVAEYRGLIAGLELVREHVPDAEWLGILRSEAKQHSESFNRLPARARQHDGLWVVEARADVDPTLGADVVVVQPGDERGVGFGVLVAEFLRGPDEVEGVRAAELVEDAILDALIPPIQGRTNTPVSYTSEPGKMPDSDYELNERTREKFREKIRNGELEDRKIEIRVQQSAMPGVGALAPGMDEASMMNIQEMISGMMPKKTKKRRVTIAEARTILLEEEAVKLIDMDDVVSEALDATARWLAACCTVRSLTFEIESAANDPMAILLTTVAVASLASGESFKMSTVLPVPTPSETPSLM